jgi:hypothetical protein
MKPPRQFIHFGSRFAQRSSHTPGLHGEWHEPAAAASADRCIFQLPLHLTAVAGTGSITSGNFEAFLKQLGPPLGLEQEASDAAVYKLAAQLEIPLVEDRLPFLRTLYELLRFCVYHPLPVGSTGRYQIDALVAKHFPTKVRAIRCLLESTCSALVAPGHSPTLFSALNSSFKLTL